MISSSIDGCLPSKDAVARTAASGALRRRFQQPARYALEGDERTGAQIVYRSLEEPLRQLADNAGLEGSVVVNEVRNAKGKNDGLNVETGEIVDLVAAGVIDPAMVTRSALQNGRRHGRHGRNDVGSLRLPRCLRGPAPEGPSSLY